VVAGRPACALLIGGKHPGGVGDRQGALPAYPRALWLENETAVIDPQSQQILQVSPGAWRHLGRRVFDSAADRVRILPAEFHGPLPQERVGTQAAGSDCLHLL
jgi:hypothetical protein